MTDRDVDLDREYDEDIDLLGGSSGGLDVFGGDSAASGRAGGAHRHRHRKPARSERGRGGHSRGGASKRRRAAGRTGSKSKGRSLAAMLIVVVLLGALGGGVWYGGSKVRAAFGNTPDFTGAGTGEVTVRIMQGDTAADVARALAKAGVIKSAQAFVSAAENDPRATALQPGTYRLRKEMKATAALDLLFDPASRLRFRIVLPEGLTVAQTLERIATTTGMPLADLQAAARDTSQLGLPAYAVAGPGRQPGLEGFLYPATYDLEPGMSAVTILRTMVAKFDAVATSTRLEERAKDAGLTPYKLLIIASMVQREGRTEGDNPKIARVIYNRLKRDMALEIDATVLYGLGRTSGPLTQADLDKETPYNTRRIKGLPPTPIASPGAAVIEATLSPADGNWIYYVIKDKAGNHLFTADYNAFLAQKARSRAAGLL